MRFYVLKLLFLTKFRFACANFILERLKNVGTMLKEQFCPLQLFGVCLIIYLLGKTGMAVAFARKSSKLAFLWAVNTSQSVSARDKFQNCTTLKSVLRCGKNFENVCHKNCLIGSVPSMHFTDLQNNFAVEKNRCGAQKQW